MINSFIVIFFAIAHFGYLEAKGTYGNLLVKKVHHVHDGDTFIVDIAEVHPIIGEKIAIRINGIDAPEITDSRPTIKEKAYCARDYVSQRLKESLTIELRNIQRDKYFRILADVYLDGLSLASELINMGLVLPYDGHKKPIWENP